VDALCHPFARRVPAGVGLPGQSAGSFHGRGVRRYEALSLWRTGADRWNLPYPAYFVASGSGQNVLYSYLSIPAVAALGLSEFSVRLVNLVLGILTLPLVFVFVKRLYGERPALLSTFLVAVLPWHIMISRWANDSSPLPFFLLLGAYGFSRGLGEEGCGVWTPVSLVPWAASLYAYVVSAVVVPIFLGLAFLCFPFGPGKVEELVDGCSALCHSILSDGAVSHKEFCDSNMWEALKGICPSAAPVLPYSRLVQVTSPILQRLELNLSFCCQHFQAEISRRRSRISRRCFTF